MKHLFTIGHSTRELDEFFEILKNFNISHLIDVRTIPKSRRVPWFNSDHLKLSCRKKNIYYKHLPEIGGLRKAEKDSINAGWRNSSFRGFADYMQTPAFFEGLKKLNSYLVNNNQVVIMCAEALPWRCHRSLIADAEVIRDIQVDHIMSKTNLHSHKLTAFAVVKPHTRPKKIYYPENASQYELSL